MHFSISLQFDPFKGVNFKKSPINFPKNQQQQEEPFPKVANVYVLLVKPVLEVTFLQVKMMIMMSFLWYVNCKLNDYKG